MKVIDNLRAVYGYTDIFGLPSPSDPFLLLRQYSTKNILIKIAYINAILYNNKDTPDIQIFQEVLFGSISSTRKLVRDIDYKLANGHFFASAHLSELIKETLNNYSEEQSPHLKYEEFAADLFKSILIFNEKYNGKLAVANDLVSFRSIFTLGVLQQYYIRSTPLLTYIVKFAFACKFLSEDSQLKPCIIQFCQDYGMASPWNISQFLIGLYKDADKEIPKFVLEKASVPTNFFKDWSINREFIDQKKGFSLNFDIIPRPLFETNDNKVVILDFNYFQYTVDQGFFYKIFDKSIKNTDSSLNNLNQFKSYIGTHYFEKFLCKKLLEKIFCHRQQIIYSDDKYQDFLIKSSSDNILVIETKMTDVHAKTIENLDFDHFVGDLNQHFLSKKEKKGKNKGAYQILSQLRQICDSKNYNEISKILKVKTIRRLNIYPILLTSDNNYNLFGTNKYINEQILEDFAGVRNGFQSVQPVLVLNVNTLIEYFAYFKSNKTHLTDLIKGYFKEIKKNERYHVEGNKNVYSYLMSSISFDRYLENKLKHKTIAENFSSFSSSFASELSNLSFATNS